MRIYIYIHIPPPPGGHTRYRVVEKGVATNPQSIGSAAFRMTINDQIRETSGRGFLLRDRVRPRKEDRGGSRRGLI